MLDIRDPAIKLFGKTIPLLSDEADEVATTVGFNESSCESVDEDSSSDTEKKKRKQIEQRTAVTGAEEEKQSAEPIKVVNPPSTEKEQESKNNHQTEQEKKNSKEEPIPNNVSEEDSQLQEDPEKEQDDGKKNPQERTLKKPDKIIPCPRCNSMETKFCYYNNYNVNQPRHFCKSCQRYWTAGGTMRNIPIGAGRRKNKSSGSRYCQISVSDALQAAQIDLPNGTYGTHHPIGFKANGTVLTFGGGPDSALCDSMASVLNLTGEKKDSGATKNEFHKSDHQIPVRGRENGDDRSTASSTVTSASVDEGGNISSSKDQVPQNLKEFAHQIPCFSGFQWPYGWNPCVFPPGFCPPAGIPMPFYPPPYWNGVAPIPWNVPWASSSCAPGCKSPSSNPSSPLGKHSRNGESLRPNDPERSSGTSSVLVPKTLRIDDPEEAAKSSIWATLGIKKEKVDSASSGGFFKGLQSKKLSEEKNDHQEKIKSSPVFKANPAAFARSISLREGV